MTIRTLSAAVLSAAAAALVGGALFTPISQADPGSDTTPPCVAEGTCAVLQKSQPKYLPLTPATTAPQSAPLTPAR